MSSSEFRRGRTSIRPITRAVVVLDHSSGALREEDGQLLGLDLWPETRALFSTLNLTQLEVVLAVPTDLAADQISGLSGWTEGLSVARIAPDMTFSDGRGLQGLSIADPPTAFVSADRRMRGEATKAGMLSAPHVLVLPMMLRGEVPDAVRMVGAKEVLTRLGQGADVIPLHFQPSREDDWALIALASGAAQASAVMKGVEVHGLPHDPMNDDLVWARISQDDAAAQDVLATRRILHTELGQVLIALAPEESAQALHVHGSHGHAELLMPDPNLLRPAIRDSLDSDALDERSLPRDIFAPVQKFDPNILKILRPACSTVAASYESDLDRYTSVVALDANGPIVSRHSAHPDNKRAEAALLVDLNAIGYCAHRHSFTYAGQTHSNIIADLTGTGVLRIKPTILKRYRRILRDNPLPKPLEPWKAEMAELTSEGWFQSVDLGQTTDAELRYRIERIFRLRPWYPWWRRLCSVAGPGSDLVIVGCHLDSTAGFEPGYVAATDPAPGRDDNGSGLAGVLSMARHLWGLRGKLTHTVRFCFFNAEESGLVGSKAYAAKMKSLDAPIRAVICMDMIGHNSDPNRLFEIHAGYTDPAVRDLSLRLATYVANAAAARGGLAPAQIYAGTSWSGAPDRCTYDGAINRSDHASFHQQGYPAILVSEDFFANLSFEPGADPNPDYHKATDTVVDIAYARDIVCAVTDAVIQLAR